MRFLVRMVTWASLLLAACGRAHVLDEDAGSEPEDAPAPDAPEAPDAPIAPAVCELPIAEWRLREIDLGGTWASIAGARNGLETAIAVPDGSGGEDIMLFRFATAGPGPTVARAVSLEGTRGLRPVRLALDGFRSVVITAAGSMHVHDVSGRLLAEWVGSGIASTGELALRDVRIGVIAGGGPAGDTTVAVYDVAGGPPTHVETLRGWSDPGIGWGRGLFAMMLREDAGTTHFFGLDELGAIDALDLDVAILTPTSDGTTMAGLDAGATGLVIRYAGGRLESRDLPSGATWRDPSVAEGPAGALVIAVASELGIHATLPDRSIPLTTAVPTYARAAFADQTSDRAGAFWLASGGSLRWAGLTCLE